MREAQRRVLLPITVGKALMEETSFERIPELLQGPERKRHCRWRRGQKVGERQWGVGVLLLWEGGTQKAHTAQEGLVTATGAWLSRRGKMGRGL